MVRVAYIEIYNEAVRDLLNPYKPISNKAFCIENDVLLKMMNCVLTIGPLAR